ncbi:AFR069Cp [Eremothecium gossypii ATCC 10895]|uniref:AFR069Cp n=1 Tax=Eremothecium gossypii (strain ATCC 10895 / CBS 109.51 / FGSC 9923 / NRRL Y-1056) TaxID=284811 RepID=Q754K3_EREGS|nr:AFR069Cp [Eremothecium gossypii ATCC 10895]AAS53440.2 AFR069Cp [Eremothecium gossypii ATCC 10895]AEY97752.1 FAFR069Cp [Eremothecium gossypii FDAG1]
MLSTSASGGAGGEVITGGAEVRDGDAESRGDGRGAGAGCPVCQNCHTSTTPLWRRDEHGAVLCNACGLFLKLHGRPRPISLKTDVIKSRNRKAGHEEKRRREGGEGSGPAERKRGRAEPGALPQLAQLLNGVPEAEPPTDARPGSALHGPGPARGPAYKSPINMLLNDKPQDAGFQPAASPAASVLRAPSLTPVPAAPAYHAFSPRSQPPSQDHTAYLHAGLLHPQGLRDGAPFAPADIASYSSSAQIIKPAPDTATPLSQVLHSQEEVIRLKTRINELELINDLYKRHIFELNDRCKMLEMKHQLQK